MVSVQGTKSRELLASMINKKDRNILSDDNFPYSTAKMISLNLSGENTEEILSMRVTFVGELGYELYLPYSICEHVVDRFINNTNGIKVRTKK